MICGDAYIEGQTLRFPIEFRSGHDLVDPAPLKFVYETPDKTVTTLVFGVDNEVKRDSLGKFYVDLVFHSPGLWKWHWKGGLSTPPTWSAQGALRVVKAEPA